MVETMPVIPCHYLVSSRHGGQMGQHRSQNHAIEHQILPVGSGTGSKAHRTTQENNMQGGAPSREQRGDLEGGQSEADPASPGVACCRWENSERRGTRSQDTA
jgi:hypothetical protein